MIELPSPKSKSVGLNYLFRQHLAFKYGLPLAKLWDEFHDGLPWASLFCEECSKPILHKDVENFAKSLGFEPPLKILFDETYKGEYFVEGVGTPRFYDTRGNTITPRRLGITCEKGHELSYYLIGNIRSEEIEQLFILASLNLEDLEKAKFCATAGMLSAFMCQHERAIRQTLSYLIKKGDVASKPFSGLFIKSGTIYSLTEKGKFALENMFREFGERTGLAPLLKTFLLEWEEKVLNSCVWEYQKKSGITPNGDSKYFEVYIAHAPPRVVEKMWGEAYARRWKDLEAHISGKD